jgi:hypothetical protein
MNSDSYIAEEGKAAYEFHGHKCRVCGKPANQLAHRIPQRKGFLAQYGWYIIHSRYNRIPVCSLPCNAQAQCKASSAMEVENIALEIITSIGEAAQR